MTDAVGFNTYVVIEFEPDSSKSAKLWLKNKLEKSKEDSGAELLTALSTNANGEVSRHPFVQLHELFKLFYK